MAVTLPSTPLPDESTQKTVAYNISSMQFGNGYQQDAALGINFEYEVWDMVYTLLSQADRDAIVAVLSTSGSWDIINWTAPGGAAKLYKMDKAGYTEDRVAATYSLKFKLKQVF